MITALHIVTALFSLIALVAALSSPLVARASGEFHRGVNLSNWFEQEGRLPVSLTELSKLRLAGFDHVRIPVDPTLIGWRPTKTLEATRLAQLEQAVANALAAGLDVIVDISPDDKTKDSIESENAVFKSYSEMLGTLARPLARLPRNRIALELLNEPQFYGWNGGRWQSMQAQLIASVRAVAPDLTLIAMGNKGGSLAGLADLESYPDPNVIYSFHYYSPFIFTHQGASWSPAGIFAHVLYPSELALQSPPAILPIDKSVKRARSTLDDYLNGDWNATTIAARLMLAGDLAKGRNIRIICDEFGVIRDNVDPASRNRWLHDVRTALERMNIGWTVWEYADGFGVASKQASAEGAPELNRATATALGLPGVR